MKSESISHELQGYQMAGALGWLEYVLLSWQVKASSSRDGTVAITWADAANLFEVAHGPLMKWVRQDEERRGSFACEIAGLPWRNVTDFEWKVDALIARTRRSSADQGPTLLQARRPIEDPPPPNRNGPASAA